MTSLIFPCSLRDIIESYAVPHLDLPTVHIYGEFRGLRFYVESYWEDRHARERIDAMKKRYPQWQFYTRLVADSTQIDGEICCQSLYIEEDAHNEQTNH